MAVLSKIKLGSTTYDLKDADSRTKLSTLLGEHAVEVLGAAAWEGVDSEVTASGQGLPTTGAVKNYVDAQIGTINKFDVKIYQADSEGKPNVAASAQTMYILGLVADAHAEAGTYIEWITVRSGTDPNYSYAWEKIGSTQADLSDYLQKTATVAGVAFGSDSAISVAELEAAGALNLKALSHKDSASGSTTLATADSITMDALTIAGNAAVTHTSANATLTKGDYTPEGSVAVTLSNAGVLASVNSAGAVPTFSEGAFTPNVPTEIDVTEFNAGSLPTKAADTFSAGSLPSKAADTFVAPTLGAETKAQFAEEGVVAEVGTGDDAETLIISAASKAQAVTAQGAFNGGSFTEGAFSAGSLPSFTEGAFTQGSLPSLGDGFYTAGSAASKASDSFNAGSMPTFNTATVGVQSATFTGTEAENIVVTGVAYDKADATAAFSVTETPTGSVNKTAKDINITVS